ncbi:hypothetical protein RJ639_023222 [Escallonia herrerae]|uniref:AAA+ ATPase domain-containing protein n=1 Tax=Escallonia herrerae TaxID=1293975 RepID=A0AA88V0D8_9ASTE|nr:hypothetical protein RJ639_023222 [Escallonia herrerae]
MKATRRAGRGGGGQFERLLRRHVENSYKHNHTTVDQIVDHLRSTVTEFSRQKLQPFTKQVQLTLNRLKKTPSSTPKYNSTNRRRPSDDDDSSPPQFRSPDRKRLKNLDRSEEKLQALETNHLQRKNREAVATSSSAPSSSSSGSGSSDEEDGAVSTSEDAIYEVKFEPEFDLMKSMLRTGYSGAKKYDKLKDMEDKNLELEVSNAKAMKKVDFIDGDRIEAVGRPVGGENLGKRKSKGGNEGGGSEVKGKDGPRFRDLGGMSSVVEELKMEVIVPLYHPQLPQRLGVKPMAGILLHGPPGCGKTKLAHAIANETGVPFYKISATEVVSGISGDAFVQLCASEENIRELFSKAYRTAPSIVFIDEIDAIASKRENLQREMERRIVTQLMTFEGSFDLVKIARSTPGFVGADLAALADKAGNLAMKRIIDERKIKFSREPIDEEHADEWWKNPWSPEEMEKLSITMVDFEEAAKLVQPSSRREGFSTVPNVRWDDVGGLHLLRQEFDRYIVRRIKYPDAYEEFGVDLETGFLLYGPPGCGKTLIAKAVANEAGANFIHIKGPELLNKYVGESELAVRTIFGRARTCSPCILFFDEVDALTTKRGKEGGWVVERLLNQLLIELDGADQRRGVYVIGATNRCNSLFLFFFLPCVISQHLCDYYLNRPEVMDRALLRPGRFGKLLYVPLPTPDERGLILKALSRKKPLDASVDLVAIGRNQSCENLSGADLAALMNEAAMAALDEKQKSADSTSESVRLTIKLRHFEQALEKISPSVSEKQKQFYQLLSESFKVA